MSWTWQAGPWRTGPEVELASATGRSVTWKRGDNHTSGFTIDGLHPAARRLADNEGISWDCWIARNDVVQHRGRIGSNTAGDIAPPAASTGYGVVDYKELLTRRILAGPHITWANADPADAFWDVIADEQARVASNLAITRGVVVKGGTVAAFNVEIGKPVREALDTLAGLNTGADWDLRPNGYLDIRADWSAPTLGTDRQDGIVLDVGGRVTSAGRTFDPAAYANAGYFSGQVPEGGTVPPPAIRLEAAGLASLPEGRLEWAESTDQTTAAGLAARAKFLLAERQKGPVAWTAKLARGFWQGRSHFFVGDVVRFVCKVPPYDVDASLSVEEISATFNGPGEPDVSVTLGRVPTNPRLRERRVDQRLAALERH